MSKKQNLASFCRLCLVKTTNKVPVFGGEQENVTNLLALIELNINPKSESNAAICMDCIVILEGFCEFKEKCRENDEYLKTNPPKDNEEGSEACEDENEEFEMECDYLEEDDNHKPPDGEQQSPVKDVDSNEPTGTPKKKILTKSPKKLVPAPKPPVENVTRRSVGEDDPLDISGQVKIVRKQMAKPLSSSCKDIPVQRAPVEKYLFLPKFTGPQPTADDLPKLQDSYPDCFHFEKSSRTLYFDLVYYGERFNSAIYGQSYTYWQCAYRKRFHCPAMVHVKNDYTHFERRFEHTHDEMKRKGTAQVLTPKQALPAVFRICWSRMKEKQAMREHFRKYNTALVKDKDSLRKKSWLIKTEAPAPDSDDDDEDNVYIFINF